MEGYSSVSSGLEPAFEADDQHSPAEGKASDSNSNIKKHHYICRKIVSCHEEEKVNLDYHHNPGAWRQM
jgi:hypothetical protein